MPHRRVAPRSGRHGANVPSGLDRAAATGDGRFVRMFRPDPPAPPLDDAAIDELVAVIDLPFDPDTSGENPRIPAGYTYLGQFVDHDITFDPTPLAQRGRDPLARRNFRTPRLDLDSLYGAGPDDQPYLYEWKDRDLRGVKLGVGVSRDGRDCVQDLPRNAQGLAIIGDPRNDENLIVAQLHLLFILFHNKVVDVLRGRTDPPTGRDLFVEAQRIVRWHYQWIVMNDFLPRVVGRTMANSVLSVGPDGPVVRRRFYDWEGEPRIPLEFSGAAYRFGHSMVRDTYGLNDRPTIEPAILSAAAKPGPRSHLGGFRPLPPRLGITWENFYEIPGAVTRSGRTIPQLSNTIDPKISPRLRRLPADLSPKHDALARLNILRARDLALPTGFEVADAMGEPRLRADELYPTTVASELLRTAPPLWHYVLAEARAQHRGAHLGRVGGRIVAEVLAGLLEGDPCSYLHRRPAWRPDELVPGATDFMMADLVTFTNPARPRI